MSSRPPFAASWLQQRDAAALAIAAVEDDELRCLSGADARRQADAVLSAAPIALMNESRRTTSGLVEQQRLFARARR